MTTQQPETVTPGRSSRLPENAAGAGHRHRGGATRLCRVDYTAGPLRGISMYGYHAAISTVLASRDTALYHSDLCEIVPAAGGPIQLLLGHFGIDDLVEAAFTVG